MALEIDRGFNQWDEFTVSVCLWVFFVFFLSLSHVHVCSFFSSSTSPTTWVSIGLSCIASLSRSLALSLMS